MLVITHLQMDSISLSLVFLIMLDKQDNGNLVYVIIKSVQWKDIQNFLILMQKQVIRILLQRESYLHMIHHCLFKQKLTILIQRIWEVSCFGKYLEINKVEIPVA